MYNYCIHPSNKYFNNLTAFNKFLLVDKKKPYNEYLHIFNMKSNKNRVINLIEFLKNYNLY